MFFAVVRYGPSGKGHYFLAVASFTAYLLGWLGPRSETSAALGTRIMSALVRGRALAYESTPGSRLSTSRRAA